MTMQQSDDKRPTPDPAEDNAFFPSPYSLSQFTSPKSDLSGADYPTPYTGGRWKILVVGADERYLLTDNGTLFSTGNHPVETLLVSPGQSRFRLRYRHLVGQPGQVRILGDAVGR